MTTPAYELARYLEAQGVGTFGGTSAASWSINVGVDADTPDTTIVLNDDSGGEPDTDELDIQDHTVTVRVRSGKDATAYLDAYAKAEEIKGLLIHEAPLVTNTMRFIGIRMLAAIANLGQDDNNRFILSATYQAQRQE